MRRGRGSGGCSRRRGGRRSLLIVLSPLVRDLLRGAFGLQLAHLVSAVGIALGGELARRLRRAQLLLSSASPEVFACALLPPERHLLLGLDVLLQLGANRRGVRLAELDGLRLQDRVQLPALAFVVQSPLLLHLLHHSCLSLAGLLAKAGARLARDPSLLVPDLAQPRDAARLHLLLLDVAGEPEHAAANPGQALWRQDTNGKI